MLILPAIDLLEGTCVRLVQGRYDRIIHYQRDPVAVASEFRDAGAEWLHVIDLDGARDGRVANIESLRSITRATRAKVEFGGGVRDEAAVDAALDAGASRVIIGTRALEDWDWFCDLAHQPRYAGKLALGLDARQGRLATRGWTQSSERRAAEVVEAVSEWPLSAIVYTDIGRDGLLLGPNFDAIRSVAALSRVPVIAAGGITDRDDVVRLSRFGLLGAVVGRAIYEGTLELDDALRAARGEPAA